ncbi:unnamed protein product [Acanthoscelides obtectus]|uniref:SAM and SH3 domain-containing protein 1 n=1 Tax=Acanthoscelides obtectus TaxID=200917 RepID=A0A9P0M093_ACAOB|nr:unnamed protein product [Acanthoscelides obtectus]CAK1660618.1 SAM and SH3 domain-containing protein 3 [Acanthoscelides obtectus]
MSDLGQNAVLRSMVDPMDYDRLRHLQMNGGTPNTFEETIYRLKVQEALRKREKFTKDHEEILRDIKQGLLNLGKEGIRGPLTGDDTYMYDEDARMLAPTAPCAPAMDRPAHWYDEPPYESDPEDFLMGGQGQPLPQATFRNGRVCFTLNLKQEPRSEGVISLRSAGDISLPKDSNGGVTTPRRGLILPPQAGYPPTIIPLRSSRDRESGDYASDVQSVSSRLSNLSVDTSRSEQLEMGQLISPKYYDHHHHHHNHHHHHESRLRQYRRVAAGAGYARSEDEGMSPSQSSDYEDQEDFGGGESSEQVATVHVSSDGRASSLVGKVRGLREDVQRKISRMKGENSDQRRHPQDQAFPCSASSVESLPSGSGSSTQALVRAGSNHSSISTEDAEPSPTEQIVGRARALVDQVPSPYDKDALKFKAGDIIEITSMNQSGLWRGICHGRRGTFKFINVELMSERSVKSKRETKWHRNIKGRPATVEDLLKRIGLQEYTSVFVLNGYEDLELFKEIEPSDLDYLGIVNVDHRAKILSAVQLLHDLDSGSEADAAGGSSSDGGGGAMHPVGGPFDHRHHLIPAHYSHAAPTDTSPFNRRCYAAIGARQPTSPGQGAESDASDGIPGMGLQQGMGMHMQLGDKNNLDSVVERCSNEILARQAQKNSVNLKEELSYQPNIPNSASTELQQHQTIQQRKPKDSYVSVHGQTTLIDPCRRSLSKGRTKEEICETDPKLASVKYVVGGGADDLGTLNVLGRSCLSEKSSDSGVSSSSLSSGNVKEPQNRPALQQSSMVEPPHSPHIALRIVKQNPTPGQGQPT